jgi:hypothetical protein
MKKDAGLGKLYNRFTGEERFRLVIEALFRGDEEEAESLSETCPRATYTMSELAYGDRLKASSQITMVLCLDLTPRLAKLRMIEAFQEILPYLFNRSIDEAHSSYLDGHEAGSKRAWEAAGKEGDPPGWAEGDEEDEDPVMEEELRRVSSRLKEEAGDFADFLEEPTRHIVRDTLTIWKAFEGFCTKELLLEPEKLVKAWFEPMLPDIEKLKDIPDSPEADPERLEEYEAALKRTWRKLVRQD